MDLVSVILCVYNYCGFSFVSIKISGNNRQDRNTLWIATTHRLNQEIKFLHVKKSELNDQLYKAQHRIKPTTNT